MLWCLKISCAQFLDWMKYQPIPTPINGYREDITIAFFGLTHNFCCRSWGMYAFGYRRRDSTSSLVTSSLEHRYERHLRIAHRAGATPPELGVIDQCKVYYRHISLTQPCGGRNQGEWRRQSSSGPTRFTRVTPNKVRD